MGKRNYLVEGGSGVGKSAVWEELCGRGYTAVNGDRELAYQGDPETGERTDTLAYEFHIWDVDRVRTIARDTADDIVFFCGGSRNFSAFIDVFDRVFVLTVDAETLRRRIADRAADDWGGTDEQKDFILRLHATGGDVPDGTIIDTRRPVSEVVDAILRHVEA